MKESEEFVGFVPVGTPQGFNEKNFNDAASFSAGVAAVVQGKKVERVEVRGGDFLERCLGEAVHVKIIFADEVELSLRLDTLGKSASEEMRVLIGVCNKDSYLYSYSDCLYVHRFSVWDRLRKIAVVVDVWRVGVEFRMIGMRRQLRQWLNRVF